MIVVLIITFILSFCSITYELLLGQALAAFLGNTIFRYSITIGLYLFSMGIGSLLAEKKYIKLPFLTILIIEILLIFFGSLSIIHLHLANMLTRQTMFLISPIAHLLIFIIGMLTGFELPLIMEIVHSKLKFKFWIFKNPPKNIKNKNLKSKNKDQSTPDIKQDKNNIDNILLGVSYTGAFFGTIIFAVIFYPKLGLLPSAILIGILNSVASLLLIIKQKQYSLDADNRFFKIISFLHTVIFISLIVLLLNSQQINNFFMHKYVGN